MYRLAKILFALAIVLTDYSIPMAHPYKAKFLTEPIVMPAEDGLFRIRAWVDFGPVLSEWDYDSWCFPPPPFFAVVVDWLSPNGPTTDECWINVFAGTQAVCIGIRGGNITNGTGGIWMDNSDLPFNGYCWNWSSLRCGQNHFRLDIGPLLPSGDELVPGMYRISLLSLDYHLWPDACDPNRDFRDNWVYTFILLGL
jgi:hypothetical protein